VHRAVILALAEACENPRAPVLACRDALKRGDVAVDIVTARSDGDIDSALASLADGEPAGLIVAAATDGQLRAVLRRLVRRYAPPPSGRPDDLPPDRTVRDLPPLGLLPLAAGQDLGARLGLPRSPDDVARAFLDGQARRLDLLRNDGGSVTLDGALLGGTDPAGRAVAFAARIEVDDAVLSDGREQLLVAAVANADGYATFDGLPLLIDPDPGDGQLDVAVALPTRHRGRVRVEVRRAHGRAVAVTPRDDIPFLDDGVAGTLGRKRSWWMERAAWAVYAPGR
jgi:hypothetical protein